MKILVVRFSSLGDVVMASAAVEACAQSMPDARIWFLTMDRFAPLYEDDPRLAGVIRAFRDDSPSAIADRLAGEGFDCAVDLHGSLRSRAVTLLMKNTRVLRIAKHSLARRLMVLTNNRYRRSFNVLESYLAPLRRLGITGRVLPRLIPQEDALSTVRPMLQKLDSPVVGIAPGARHAPKRWREDGFAAVGDAMAARGRMPVFIGDEYDIPVIERIRGMMTAPSLSWAGRFNVAGTVAAVSLMEALVTNDTGPMHIAGALGVPFAAVFGPTHPNLGFVPGYPGGTVLHTGLKCSPCSIHGSKKCRFGHRDCMNLISADDVIGALPGG